MKRFFGGLLLAVGILLMTASGICSIAVIVTGLPMLIKAPSLVLFPLIIGGLPFAAGAALFWVGSRLLKETNRP